MSSLKEYFRRNLYTVLHNDEEGPEIVNLMLVKAFFTGLMIVWVGVFPSIITAQKMPVLETTCP